MEVLGQLYATAALSLCKPSVLPFEHEPAWVPEPVWMFLVRDIYLLPILGIEARYLGRSNRRVVTKQTTLSQLPLKIFLRFPMQDTCKPLRTDVEVKHESN
jgi:hypothetical protein